MPILAKNSKSPEEVKYYEEKFQQIQDEIAQSIAERNVKLVKDQVQNLKGLEGTFSQHGLWKVKNKLCPRQRDPPMGKKDSYGNLIVSHNALKELYSETYATRLRHREISERFRDIHEMKTNLWKLRFETLRLKVSKPWTLKDFEKVAKSLKHNQSRDPVGMINELFKDGVAGQDLKIGLVKLMNIIKSSFIIPDYMQLADITSIYKNKGSRQDLKNDRGIFILPVLRKILDKLVYQEKYQDLDSSMSDSNIGARKNKNVRNHLFIVYGVINNVLRNKTSCVDIQIYDLVQAFDSLWLQDCMNELYDALPDSQRDDKLALVFKSNVSNLVAVNTPVGETRRMNIPEIVQQGGCWGPMECSVAIDKVGKVVESRGPSLYKYKGLVNIIPLAMVDDLLGIAPCGIKSIELNTLINTQIEMKRLRFHTPDATGKTKCHKIHVGKRNDLCPKLEVHETEIAEVTSDVYLGDEISADGSNKKNIARRIAKGQGKIAEILALLDKVSLGVHYFEIAVLLRESIFLSSVLLNSEVWYGVTEDDISQLENLDKSLLLKILKVPRTTPVAGIYLELGCPRIRTILKARRINYLRYLLSLKKEEMLFKVFMAQWEYPQTYDWVEQVKTDLRDFNMSLDLESLREKSLNSFKKYTKKKAYEYELKQLIGMKDLRSKLRNLSYEKLEMQQYLKDYDFMDAIVIFKFRTRMAPFNENFKGQGPPKLCPLCENFIDSQIHSFHCSKMISHIEINGRYEDIFKQKINKELLKTLKKILEYRSKNFTS